MMNVEVSGLDKAMANATAGDITIINFGMGSPNAATIIDDQYRDTEDNDGVFSGLMEYKAGVPE